VSAVPVVDLGDYRKGSGAPEREWDEPAARFVGSLRDGLVELGFIAVEGHGIDPDLVRRVYAHYEAFFAGDEGRKRSCAGVAGGQRGYTPFGVEHARDQARPDLKEFFHVGQQGGERWGYPANVWPADGAQLRDDSIALFRALERVSMLLLEALADGFGLRRDTFAGMLRGGNSVLRALHYPPVRAGAHPGSLRAAAHEDINLITLLCGATEPGLQIRPPGRDTWLPVEVAPGQIVVDSGDMLSRLTNDRIPATTHRVVNPAGAANVDRYSLPFFAHPRPDCDLSVLPRFVDAGHPPRHPPITAGAYLDERLREIGLVS